MNGIVEKTRIDGHRKTAIETCRNRLLFVGILFFAMFGVICLRLVDVSLFPDGALRVAERPRTVPEPAVGRAEIIDRNGVLLASNVTMVSLFANPRDIAEPAEVADQLSEVLPDLDRDAVIRKLASNRQFVWLRRHLTPRLHHLVNKMGIPGVGFLKESRRVYPLERLTGNLVGFTNIDRRGLSGVERYFDDALRSGGDGLELSVDVRVQHALAVELERSMKTFDAVGAAGLVMDVRTAEILATVSLPALRPNFPGSAAEEALFNRNIQGVYEMGSIFKIFTVAMALDGGGVGLGDMYDASRPMRVARFTVSDYHAKNRWLSVPEIFTYSSNIGTVRIAQAVGADGHLRFLSKLGLLAPVALEFSKAGTPIVPASWRAIHSVTASYGYGVAVTPVHVAAAVSAVVNGGVYRDPTLVRRADAGLGRRVVSERTSHQMRRLLRTVVVKGTGRKAGRTGYLVGGKTGTAEKAGVRGYRKNSLISSFVGTFPMHEPRYVVFVMLDEPKGTPSTHGRATGGWVAAPTAGAVIRRVAPILGVFPVAEGDPVRPALAIDLDGVLRERQVEAH